MEHIENIKEIRAAVKHILFEEYHLESVNDIFELDGETLAEMYEQLKAVMEEYGLDGEDVESILNGIDD
ncbi:hypothetical protein [Escherichia fergusonii]|uniref:hypothetical protein n=1 Tax=Escherichia fergusonii TaxID=564 RepID=UPI000F68FDF5|nr:hypothetical protein [Escherichia fergusonii]MBA5613948.1 hypothetical protein [Escherichia fergusonii]MBA5663221.1 hypothetical protein [Escherichia fergusonii]MBA8156770.1 hypothetical protein [Escherichia fergusonii]MBA8172692.1 hypothetical protein [Escherichia fergusonii]MBA8183242.1 hypothetical protein [Escherichia fergusonii]